MVVNGEHEKISIGRVLVSGSTPHREKRGEREGVERMNEVVVCSY